ncbi:VOC family protein [Brevibacterium zhoupengii]|uniref:VOC family protein n=1 Tax=Brevibacterium zhoupengii TaxID=2898795 RepID=UPI001E2A4FF6|nr:VOC family protein [Brevibacterium zhoupengii]
MPNDDRRPAGAPFWVESFQPDPHAAAEFYAALLGWSFDNAPGVSDGAEPLLALAGGKRVASIRQSPDGVPPTWLMHIRVENLARALAEVDAVGGSSLMSPSDWDSTSRMSIVADSTGVPFCIREADSDGGVEASGAAGAWAMSSLHSSDVQAAQDFYGWVFGWELRPVPDTLFSAWSLADQPVGLLIDAGDTPQHWSLNFAVADADTTARSAAELGGTVLLDPFDTDQHRNTVIADPAGAVIACSSLRA